jgi:hypothetical protein
MHTPQWKAPDLNCDLFRDRLLDWPPTPHSSFTAVLETLPKAERDHLVSSSAT